MPRRYADYLPTDGFTALNLISTVGAFLLGASMLPFVWNVFRSYRYGEAAGADDPWASATHSNGRRPAHRRVTTSPSCRRFGPNAPRSSCTTPA